MSEVAGAAEKAQPSIERGKNVEMVYSEQGEVKMRLKAKTLTRYATEEPYAEFNDGLEVYFYGPGLEVTSTLTADYGIRFEQTEQTIVRNNVEVVNERGDLLTTEELIWEPSDKKIYSDKFVQIRTEEEVIYGTGFEADEQFTRYKILNPEGTISVDVDEEGGNP